MFVVANGLPCALKFSMYRWIYPYVCLPMYKSHMIVLPYLTITHDSAVRWYRMAAEQGLALEAQCNFGFLRRLASHSRGAA